MWLVIGFVIGALAAWWYLKRQHEEQIGTLNDKSRRVETELAEERRAHGAIKGQLSDTTAAPSLAPTADAESPATEAPDDLTTIKGIGAVLQEKLNKAGIVSYQQVADFTAADIERINNMLDFRGRIEREKWVEQAKAMLTK